MRMSVVEVLTREVSFNRKGIKVFFHYKIKYTGSQSQVSINQCRRIEEVREVRSDNQNEVVTKCLLPFDQSGL